MVENDKAEVKYALLFSEEEQKEVMLAFEKLISYFDIRPATSKEDQLCRTVVRRLLFPRSAGMRRRS